MATHADADHYGWIVDLFNDEALKNKMKKKSILWLCGGSKSQYDKAFIDFMQIDLLSCLYCDAINPPPNPLYIQDSQLTCLEINQFLERFLSIAGGPPLIQVLAASTKLEKDKNDCSIVSRIQLNDCSFVITGDASGDITDKIIAPSATNVLLASHHGADDRKTNSLHWLTSMSPQYFVISHGNRIDYSHPRSEVIERMLSIGSLIKIPSHALYHGKTLLQKKGMDTFTFAKAEPPYYLSLTNSAILSTLMQGNLTFSIPSNGDKLLVAWDKGPDQKTVQTADAVMGWHVNKDAQPIHYVTELFFDSLMGIAKQFLQLQRDYGIGSRTPNLVMLNLDYCGLQGDDEADLVVSWLGSNKTVRDFYLRGHAFSPTALGRIETAWAHRGLVYE